MNLESFRRLTQIKSLPRTITVSSLVNKEPRTLLYGYNCERQTMHTYLTQDGFVRVMYDFQDNCLAAYPPCDPISLEAAILIPDKRLYPEACDFEFCLLLTQAGVYLPFTCFSEARKPEQFYGLQLHELKKRA